MQIDFVSPLSKPTDRSARLEMRRAMTESDRAALCTFGKEYFDGATGYGGYYYDGRHRSIAQSMMAHYRLGSTSTVFEVGCAKGFMLYEFFCLGLPAVFGCDISQYAITHAHPGVRDSLTVMSADRLAVPDDHFDLVFSVDVIHNLPPADCDRALQEITRVSRGCCFVQVASFDSAAQERRLREWGVTVRTFRSKTAWLKAFARVGYAGDYAFKVF